MERLRLLPISGRSWQAIELALSDHHPDQSRNCTFDMIHINVEHSASIVHLLWTNQNNEMKETLESGEIELRPHVIKSSSDEDSDEEHIVQDGT